MSYEWRTTQLANIAKLRSGFPFKSASWQDCGAPVIKIANVKSGRIQLDGCGYVSQETADAAPAWWTKEGDVLIAMTGYVGEVARIRTGERYLINQRVGRFEFNRESPVSADFLFYFLQMREVRASLEEMARGSAQPNLSAADMSRLEVPVPTAEVQKAISDLGRAFDDRIDNLRGTNATLEAIAQALFKSWFVDFDPVHAKAEGRTPAGMDAATAALFPSELEESELGPIPTGWAVHTVSDVAAVIRGRSYKSSELAASETALVTLKSFERGGGFRRDGFKSYTGPFKPEQVLSEGDCIVACTDVTQRAELIGRSALVTASPAHSRLVASLDVAVLRPTCPGMSPVFLASLLAGSRYVSHVLGHATGTTVLHLSRDAIPNYAFACPPPPLLAAYTGFADAVFQQRATNMQRGETIADLRDTLLPRLISGKLRLPETLEAADTTLA